MRFPFFIIAVSLAGFGLAQEKAAETTSWPPTRPDKIVFRSKGTAQVLDDKSIQLEGDQRWQEFTLYFEFQMPTQVQEIRVELLPPTPSTNRNRQRPSKQLILFDVKPQLERTHIDKTTPLKFSSCVYLGNPDEESSVNCIDSLTDTGWTVPAFTQDAQSHQLAFRFKEPITLDGKHRLAVTFDSGGSPELDVLSRLRVSFAATESNTPK